MSLELAAKHLAAHGRHGDSTLVHMNEDEVAGLQALARSKGKTLTRNPDTGLPEAFGLGDITGFVNKATSGLGSTVTGAALAIAFPELEAWQIAASVAGANYAATGGKSPTQSLMSGVGAFGGANIAGNVMGAGADDIYQNAVNAAEANGADIASAQQAGVEAVNNATRMGMVGTGASSVWNSPNTIQALGGYKVLGAAALPAVVQGAQKKQTGLPTSAQSPQMIRPYKFDYNPQTVNTPLTASYQPGQDTSERKWFAPTYTPLPPYQAADGGIIALAGGGPVERMSNDATTGANTMYPMSNMATSSFATPYQTPSSTNMLATMNPSSGGTVDQMSGEPNMQGTKLAAGGIANLGGYSDGGRLLRGPGDGVSDSIPAQIGNKQPARLADGEFVVPARIVSELGNGSTEAGARQLYKMMDRVQQARGKTTGKHKVAKNTNAAKYLPA